MHNTEPPSSSSSSNGISDGLRDNLVQINQEIPPRSVVAVGSGIAVAVGIMAVVGRFVSIYDSKVSVMGYLLLVLFITPLLLTYVERVEAVSAHGGLYGIVRRRYGITLTYLVGWLELAGYATVIAIMARVIAMYGLTLYEILVGGVDIKLSWLGLGSLVVVILLKLAGINGSRKLNSMLIFSGLVFMAGIGIYSLLQIPGQLGELPIALKTIAPFKLSAMLLSGFWGVILIFGMRHHIIRGAHNSMGRVSWSIMMIMIALGMLISLATIPHLNNLQNQLPAGVLSVNERSALIFIGGPIYTVLIAVFSLLVAFIGLSRALDASTRVMSKMTEDGYFPPSFNYRVNQAIFPPLLFVAALALILIFFVDSIVIVGMGTAFLTAATILIHIPDIMGSSPRLPADRPIRLPYHPLFPSLTVVTATLATLNLAPEALERAGLWLVFGVVLLVTYSYNRAIKIRAKTSIIAEERKVLHEKGAFSRQTFGKVGKPTGPPVMAVVRNFDSLPEMLQIVGMFAQQIDGALIVMQIAETPEELPEEEQQSRGMHLWRELSKKVREISLPVKGIRVSPMVRVAHNITLGIINATEELHPKYVFIAPDFIADDPDQNLHDYDEILRKSSSHIIFLNKLPSTHQFKRIALFFDRGIQAPITFELAKNLLAEDGVLEVVHIIVPTEGKDTTDRVREHIQEIFKTEDFPNDHLKITFVHADSVEEGVAQVANRVDLILMGTSKNFMTRLPAFSGVNAHLFQNLDTPMMLVAKHQKLRFAWLSRLWVFLTNPLPKLALEDREDAARSIISGADPTVDFFILILLSAGIATYGLLQNSGAVIIGAMLVAPLMSPIVAIAMSMVRGDVKHLGIAAQSTAQGVLLAIAVGAVLTFFSPIKSPTNEIMARVNPNLLDLSIAFLSGAAGAYAMSRKSIASALPGVSIAVALVPPLAVVGFGFAVADLDIAFGALLLFFTNLVAIVLAASLVFIALDFLTTEKQTWGEIVRGLRVTVIFAVIVLVILGWVTFNTVSEQHKLNAINQVLTQKLYSTSFKPLDISIESRRHGYVIKGTLLSFDRPLSAEDFTKLGKDLEQAVGGPVSLDITTIAAKAEDISFTAAVNTLKIEESVRSAIEELPVQEISMSVQASPDRYRVNLAVLAFQPNAITSQFLTGLEEKLAKEYGAPVDINVYAISAEKIEPAAVITPTLTTTPAATP